MRRFRYVIGTAVFALTVVMLRAQAPGVRVFEQSREATQAAQSAVIAKARALRDSGNLLDIAAVKDQVAQPSPEPLRLPKPGRKRLAPAEVAARAQAAHVQLGWFYLCPKCDHWHLNLAAGYAITADGVVATCEHLIHPPVEMKQGYLIAVDDAGNVFPVSRVLTKSQRMDAMIVRVAGAKLTPLPLNDQVRPGDPAFCYSEPLGQAGYFSSGIVNRFYWNRANRDAPADSLEASRYLRLNVSTDWAPGSSGAAVLDHCGNAIGHVSVISAMTDPASRPDGQPKKQPDEGGQTPDQAKAQPLIERTLIVMHEAVPARSVMLLAKAMNAARASKP